MKTDKTYLTYFSATHTSQKVGRAIAEGYGATEPIEELDGTFEPISSNTLERNNLLIACVPVYGGHVAPIALKRLEALRGNQTPAVAVAVYGNRDFETAVLELQTFLTERGFRVIAAAAFVGEHSYSTSEHPIAPNRPHSEDLQEARQFGQAIHQKVESADEPALTDADQLVCPDSGEENLRGFIDFIKACQAKAQAQPQAKPIKQVPIVNEDLCTHCGACANVCPTGAIEENNPILVNADKCIKCCACVKSCPEHARSLATPFGPVLSKYFNLEKANVKVL